MKKKTKYASQKYIDTLEKVIKYFESQTELAERLGISRQLVSMWHSGLSKIPFVYAVKIENLTNGKFKYIDLLDEETIRYLKYEK